MREGPPIIDVILALRKPNIQEDTRKRILWILLDTKNKYGIAASEKKAVELADIVNSCKTETELIQKLEFEMSNYVYKGRSAILFMRPLMKLDVQDSTENIVFRRILDANKKHGMEASEQTATEVMALIDSSQTEEEFLQKLDKLEEL